MEEPMETALQLGPDRYLGEIRERRAVAGLMLTVTVHGSPARLPPHTHATPYFCLVLAGAFNEQVGARCYEARSGELLFRPPGETHTNDIRLAGTRLLNIALGESWIHRLGQVDPGRQPRPGRQKAAAARVADRMAHELAALDSISDLSIESLALTLLTTAEPSPVSRGGPPLWLPAAREFIRANFRDRFDHDALARVAGVHATHLARAFHTHMGCTVTAYVHRLRIEWAREQLWCSDLALADLALDAGFADQAHFTRVFRRVTGATPSEFRRRSRSRPRGAARPRPRR
jgi:AraC family transcriptional regulator